MFAAVDLGSNSFRLHVADLVDGRLRIVHSARNPVRLASGLDANNMLSPAAIERALGCLRAFRADLGHYRFRAVRVVATNTLRVARNAPELLARFEEALGYPIEVISGEDEGRLIYGGVAEALPAQRQQRLVIDIGGGSTEVIAGRGGCTGKVASFGLGTQSQLVRHFPDGRITAQRMAHAISAARLLFAPAVGGFRAHGWQAVYGSSGSMRAIAIALSGGLAGAGALTLAGLQQLRARVEAFGHIDAVAFDGVSPERVAVLVGGLTVLLGAMQEFGLARVEAVDAGLRLGVLAELAARERGSVPVLATS